MADANEDRPPVESAIELVGRSEQLRGQAVHAAVALGVLDSLADGPGTVDTLPPNSASRETPSPASSGHWTSTACSDPVRLANTP